MTSVHTGCALLATAEISVGFSENISENFTHRFMHTHVHIDFNLRYYTKDLIHFKTKKKEQDCPV